MTDSTAAVRHQIASATDLQSVVRTMRALAGSSITQYERSVSALAVYSRSIDQGLSVCLRQTAGPSGGVAPSKPAGPATRGVIVFGSDQGLVGQFNKVVVEHLVHALKSWSGPTTVWAVGERVRSRLVDAGVAVAAVYPVPNSVEAIASFVDRLQIDTETHASQIAAPHIDVFFNQPLSGSLYQPVRQALLPLDAAWRAALVQQAWPTKHLPEVIGDPVAALRSLIREHLFISLFQACAQSLASENASRLAAMERADKNIDDLLERLQTRFHSQRQSSIDEELCDVTAGYAALSGSRFAQGGKRP